jgi:dTMP kinase
MTRGLFITFEGGEGCGKSTQITRLAKRLEQMGRRVVLTREPGGTALGEVVRHLLKHDPAGHGMCPESEMLLFSAARAQLVRSVIQPALEDGAVVLSDRFVDSTTVYQGMVRGLDSDVVAAVHRLAIGECMPTLTLVLTLSVAEGRKRLMKRVRPIGAETDRFEDESDEFHGKIQRAYQVLACSEPKRMRLVDAGAPADEVEKAIWEIVRHVL